jgi:hypothetical protein
MTAPVAMTSRDPYTARNIAIAGLLGMSVTLAFLIAGAIVFGIPASLVYVDDSAAMAAPWLGAAVFSLVGLPYGGYHAGRRLSLPRRVAEWLALVVATPGVWLAGSIVMLPGFSAAVLPVVLIIVTLSFAGILVGAAKDAQPVEGDRGR